MLSVLLAGERDFSSDEQRVVMNTAMFGVQILHGNGSQQDSGRAPDHHGFHWGGDRQVQPGGALPASTVQQSGHLQGQVSPSPP